MARLRGYISVFLVLIFSGGLIFQTATVVYFYSNQKEITEKYCENKAQPEKKCHGKCHLNKQLNITKSDKQHTKSTSIQTLSFWLYGVEILTHLNLEVNQLVARQITFYYKSNLSEIFFSEFVPPDIC